MTRLMISSSLMAKPIVVIGSVNMDLVCRTARRPAPGETILGRDFTAMHGGKGANQAVAAARLGAPVHLLGRVGCDQFGQQLLAGLRDNGVGIEHVSTSAGISSGVAVIVVDDSGENSIIVIPGANSRLSPADIDAATPLIAESSCVLLQLETPYATVEHAIRLCRRLGVRTILDPAPAATDTFPDAFFTADLLTPNQTEARAVLRLNPHAADDLAVGRLLLDRGAGTVIHKLGSKGAMVVGRNAAALRVDPFAAKVVDTTAAGDAFNAALAVGLAEQMDLAEAVRFANAAGALACTVLGAQPSLPDRAAVAGLVGSMGDSQ